MVAVTFGHAPADVARPVDTAPRKSLFARFFDALVESQMEKARREIRLHSRLLPYTIDADGAVRSKTETPAGGW